jgi:hypothetical protein
MGRSVAIAVALTAAFLLDVAPAPAQDVPAPARPRARIVIHPRTLEPGPNAKRYCRSWLVREYRVSGPVIVPRMECWWQ